MYRHTQTAYALTGTVLLLALLSLGALILAAPATGVATVAVLVLLVGFGCAAVFSSMSIAVEHERLVWCFGFGLLRKSVALAEIARVERTRTSPLEGWGIHWTRRGWLYNVSGFDAVWIQLRTGKQFLLGTDQPEQLVQAMEAAGLRRAG
jgi:hypothetical protein